MTINSFHSIEEDKFDLETERGLENLDEKTVDIHVFRHGETNYTGEVGDLTENGKSQVRKSAEELLETLDPEKHAVYILSSDTERTKATGMVILDVLKNVGFEVVKGKDKDGKESYIHIYRGLIDKKMSSVKLKRFALQQAQKKGQTLDEKALDELILKRAKETFGQGVKKEEYDSEDYTEEEYKEAGMEPIEITYKRFRDSLNVALELAHSVKVEGKKLCIVMCTHNAVPIELLQETGIIEESDPKDARKHVDLAAHISIEVYPTVNPKMQKLDVTFGDKTGSILFDEHKNLKPVYSLE